MTKPSSAKTNDDEPDRRMRNSGDDDDDDRDTPDGTTVGTTKPDPIGKDPEDPPQ